MALSRLEEALVLVIDDDEENLKSLERVLVNFGVQAKVFNSAEEAIGFIETSHPHVVITDMKMPGMDGMEVIRKVNEIAPEIPVIVITAFGSIGNAVEAVREGATDYLQKPVDIEGLRAVLIKSLRVRGMMEELGRLREMVETKAGTIIYRGPGMERVLDLVKSVAPTIANVLILGESGTGKELVARAIHEESKRKDMSFVPINCAALNESILESELFGHVKGAFTGAVSSARGKFESATGGTLFLDEVGELPLSTQAKLLRAIEQKEIMRVGGEKIINIDVRIVAATNSDLKTKVKAGAFREDLYYRLSVFTIEVPPLRERKEDVFPLVFHFVENICRENGLEQKKVSPFVLEAMKEYSWPGNIRELKNVVETMVLLSKGEYITEKEMPLELMMGKAAVDLKEAIPVSGMVSKPIVPSRDEEVVRTLKELEKKEIGKALRISDFNKTKAAKMLGIGLRTLYRKMKEYDIS